MKFLLISCVLLFVFFANSHSASLRVKRQLIPKEFQNVNIENYLKNPRAVAFQLKCIIYDGPCDRIGKYLKVTIPELLTNQCKNCDPDQRKKAGQLVAFIQEHYPREWNDAVAKFQGNRQVKVEDVEKFETLLGVKLAGVTTDKPITGPPDLKGLANFASQIGSQVAKEVRNEATAEPSAATPLADKEIKSASDFASGIADLVRSVKNSTPKPEGETVAVSTETPVSTVPPVAPVASSAPAAA